MSEAGETRAQPAIDFHAAGGVDRSRLERSLGLHGDRVGYGRYHFTGGAEPHWVDLYTSAFPRCDCADHLWREKICKHILAAMLREGHEHVIRAVGELVNSLLPEMAKNTSRRHAA